MKKNFHVFLFLLTLDWLTTSTFVFADYGILKFKEEELKKVAEIDGYGYKLGNLQLLDQLSKEFNKKEEPVYQVQVPDFVGIPSQNIQRFLLEKVNFNVAEKWKNLIKQYFPSDDIKNKTLESKKYPEGFIPDLKKLEEDINSAFERFIKKLNKFSFNDVFKVKGYDKLIKKIKFKGNLERLMVRSTGREDKFIYVVLTHLIQEVE